MKKFIARFTSLLLCLSFSFATVFANTNESVSDDPTSPNSPIALEWKKLEEKVNDSNRIKDGKLVPNREVISSAVAELDLETFNKVYDHSYTRESLIQEIEKSISSTSVSTSTYASNTCNLTKRVEGWNYYTQYSSKTESKGWINDLRHTANIYDNWGMVSGVLPWPYGTAFSLQFTFSGWYLRNLANSIEDYNTGGCGTIITMNKFIRSYSANSQGAGGPGGGGGGSW